MDTLDEAEDQVRDYIATVTGADADDDDDADAVGISINIAGTDYTLGPDIDLDTEVVVRSDGTRFTEADAGELGEQVASKATNLHRA